VDHSQNVSTAWSFYGTSSGVRLCWELEEPERPKGRLLPGPPRGERSGGTISGVRLYWVLEEPKGPKGEVTPVILHGTVSPEEARRGRNGVQTWG